MTIDTLPAIVRAADMPTPADAALAYASLFISVIPCDGKAPAVSWKTRQYERAGRHVIQYWDSEGLFGNVGIVCGAVSGGLVVMDFDGHAAYAAFLRMFPHLADTYTVMSGSGNGYHLYYYPETLPPTTRATGIAVGNVELRANGCYVVAPPSLHPSGRHYNVARALPIMRVFHMREVVNWIKGLIAGKHGGKMPPARNANAGAVIHATPWAMAALHAEYMAVKDAPPGARNDRLNRAAFKLGQLVAAGKLERGQVELALYEAANDLADSDGEQTVIRTVRSGLDAGMRNPRRG